MPKNTSTAAFENARPTNPSKFEKRSSGGLPPPSNIEQYLDFPIENQRALTNLLVAQRKALGKTQYQIAHEIGVDQTTISTVERKISLRMGWLTFAKIMHAYGLDLDYVMEILGVVPPKDETQDPRLQSIIHTLDDIEDPEWRSFALDNIIIWLKGLQQHRRFIDQQ